MSLHARLIHLCEAGDVEAAADTAHETWQTLTPRFDTLDALDTLETS